jgi:hypothetical protein
MDGNGRRRQAVQIENSLKLVRRVSLVAAAALLISPLAPSVVVAQSTTDSNQWLHVRVVSADSGGETVCVNVPLALAEKVLPAINKNQLHNGKIKFDKFDTLDADGVDLHAILDAVRNSKDGEFVTVNGTDEDVRVAKQDGFLLVHVTEKSGRLHHHGKALKNHDEKSSSEKESAEAGAHTVSHVEVKVPMKVVDALFSAGKDELDIVAGLRALAAQGDTELVSVKDEENTVRVWVDSKNTPTQTGATR